MAYEDMLDCHEQHRYSIIHMLLFNMAAAYASPQSPLKKSMTGSHCVVLLIIVTAVMYSATMYVPYEQFKGLP